MHRCPPDDCETQVADDLLMCRYHWRMVPSAMRQAIWRAWRGGAGRGTAAHYEACAAAVIAVEEACVARRERHESHAPRIPGL